MTAMYSIMLPRPNHNCAIHHDRVLNKYEEKARPALNSLSMTTLDRASALTLKDFWNHVFIPVIKSRCNSINHPTTFFSVVEWHGNHRSVTSLSWQHHKPRLHVHAMDTTQQTTFINHYTKVIRRFYTSQIVTHDQKVINKKFTLHNGNAVLSKI